MKIVQKNPCPVRLECIKGGLCFLYRNNLYMKVYGEYSSFYFNALNLRNGDLEKFGVNILVYPVEVEIQVL